MTTDLSKYDASQLPSADVLGRQRYAIVVADWNSEITYAMAQGAVDTFVKNGVPEENIDILHVPGAVELTYGAARIIAFLARDGRLSQRVGTCTIRGVKSGSLGLYGRYSEHQ